GAIGYFLVATAAMNLGFGAFLLARGSRKDLVLPYTVAMAFISSMYCLVMGLAYLRASLGLPWNFLYRSAWVGWIALAPLTQLILSLRGKQRQARVWGTVLYFVWTTILVLCWTTDLFEVGAVSLVPFVDLAARWRRRRGHWGALPSATSF